MESLELLDGAGERYDLERCSRGELTPMFFGSALTNFGVLPFLERFLEMAPCALRCASVRPGPGSIPSIDEAFSGFVFKIQANMDPDHRDRVAFVRVCSGRFRKGANTIARATGQEAAPGQLHVADGPRPPGGRGGLPRRRRGPVRSGPVPHRRHAERQRATFRFEGIPSFSPEHFVKVRVAEVLRRKSLSKGLEQLTQEGLVQLFTEPDCRERGSGARRGRAVAVRRAEVPYAVGVQRRAVAQARSNVTVARWIQGGLRISRRASAIR